METCKEPSKEETVGSRIGRIVSFANVGYSQAKLVTSTHVPVSRL